MFSRPFVKVQEVKLLICMIKVKSFASMFIKHIEPEPTDTPGPFNMLYIYLWILCSLVCVVK